MNDEIRMTNGVLLKSAWFAFLACFVVTAAQAAEKVTYEDQVKAIFREHCFACHNQDDPTADLALDSFEAVITGGAGGEVVAAGDPDGSRLWKLVTHQEEPTMPPDNKLPDAQLEVLQAWIAGGLLKDSGSKPLKMKKAAVTTLDASQLGKPVGEPAMPEELFHEPVLWAPHVGPIDALATSPWAPLAAVAWQRQVSLYDTNSFQLLGIIPYVDGVPRVVRFSRDGSLVLVAGGRHAAAGSASLFDVKTGARLATVGDELDIVLAADISPDLSLIAIGGPKKRVKVFRIADGELAYQITKHTDWVTALGFSPDGQLLATADRNGGALLWQAAAGHERADLRGHNSTITAVDWRADSAMIATASEDGTVRLWNPNGQQIKSINAHGGGVLSVRFAQDGNWVSVGRDHKVKTWKPDGAAIAELGQLPGMTLAAAFTHDGSKVIASDYTGQVQVFDAVNKTQVASLSANPQLLAVRLAAAEQTLQQVTQQTTASETNVKQQTAAVEQGQAAHAAHEKQMTATQASLATEKKQLEELSKLLAEADQTLTAQQSAFEAAANLLTTTQQQLLQAQAENQIQSDTELESPQEESDQGEAEQAAPEPTANAEQIAKLQKQVETAAASHLASQQALKQAEQARQAVVENRTAAEAKYKATEAKLAELTSATSTLPDMGKLNEQKQQAQVEFEQAKQQLQQAESAKAQIAAQQARFAEAQQQWTAKLEAEQTQQQELAKQTGNLEAKHEQAATELAHHQAQVKQHAEQLAALQTQLTELQTSGTALSEAESQLAEQLAKVQEAFADSERQVEMLQARQRDFSAASELRKAIADKQKE